MDTSRARSTDIQQIWQRLLEPNITVLLRNESISSQAHAGIYTTIYNVVMMDHGGQQLYAQLSAFYATYTMGIYKARPEDDSLLPSYYDSQWTRFCRGAATVDRLFNYLNRDWVELQRDEGRRDVKTVLNVALTQWRINIFDPLSPRLEPPPAVSEADAEEKETRVAILRTKFASESLTVRELRKMRFSSTQSDVASSHPSEGE
ncbi:Cullin-domain-containing protein [Mycena sanguinolenta]|uniref:Cullin-domain-containing protein n=1 Tax=Mycena sanguinolenta TaxID=230812 RepID=A0A8H6XUW0_9AGAR|nr:Cullin-domain-containing protein [Mycena sanguinolenta]